MPFRRANMKVYENEQIDVFLDALKKRSPQGRKDIEQIVSDILGEVQTRGDEALIEYTKRFDGVTPDRIEVTREEIERSLALVEPKLLEAIKKSADNIRDFHEKQRENSWFTTRPDGSILGQKVTPLERVGVYAPAGTAPLPSTVLMDTIPAKVAGVEEIILCSPPGKDGKVNPLILACAAIAGADRVFAAGGAQAVGAMAYGTKTIPKVDKIVGPGNIYVATAKKLVFGVCGVDMIAGPSEILVIADESANADYIAADLLSQAEHDVLASSVLLTTSKELAQSVLASLAKQTALLGRQDIIRQSLEDYGAIIITPTLEDAINLSNRIAPEHLELCTKDPFSLLPDIKHAGAIFLGEYSPEPLGDYFAGPNHTLPTAGTARFFSPLSVQDFVKKSSVIAYSKKGFMDGATFVSTFAEAEGLKAHAESVRVRMRRLGNAEI